MSLMTKMSLVVIFSWYQKTTKFNERYVILNMIKIDKVIPLILISLKWP